ncbi:MAG: hypothetical protein GXO39_09810 [Thermotogae bacterium]|nr:hypothetical protein [Thermotogota bacterium]
MRITLLVGISLLLWACAKVAPPPGKPEMNPPILSVRYDSVFTGFPINIGVRVVDESPVRYVRLSASDGRRYEEVYPMVRETTLVFVLDTLFDYSPDDSVWKGSALRVEAADIYDNSTSKRLFIRNPDYIPPSDTAGGVKGR